MDYTKKIYELSSQIRKLQTGTIVAGIIIALILAILIANIYYLSQEMKKFKEPPNEENKDNDINYY